MRHHADWLAAYLEYTAEHESPEKIHFWTALTVLSAAVKRQLWMERVFYQIYPNIYVLIVAESALSRKSVAVEIGMKVLQLAGTGAFLMKGRMTPEGLVKNLNRSTIVKDEKGSSTLVQDSQFIIWADELATLFGYDRTAASRMAILLTEIYGCPDLYPHTTAGEGVLPIYNVYPTVICATDPRNLKVLPEEAVAGLLGRLVFIHSTGIRKPRAWFYDGEYERIMAMRQPLVDDLKQIAKLNGEMVPTQEAKDLWEAWYNRVRETKVDDRRIEPFIARCHDTALKVAMLMAIAKRDELVVTVDDVAAGIAVIEKQLPESQRVIQWTGATEHAQLRMKMLDLLTSRGGSVHRRDLIRIMEVPVDELDDLISALTQEGRLKTDTIPRMGIVYTLVDGRKAPENVPEKL